MNWEMKKGTDYFDNREKNCIWEYSQEYGSLTDEAKVIVDQLIKNRLEGWLNMIDKDDPKLLGMIGAVIMDDIYRSGNLMTIYNDRVMEYLHATAKVVMDWYRHHDIMIHYLCNNTFSDFLRPLVIFPRMLSNSGLVYICPQHLAWLQMNEKGIPYDNFHTYYEEYEEAAFEEAQDLIRQCSKFGIHYLHLDIDGGQRSFETDFSYIDEPGHVVVLRKEAPQDSSQIEIFEYQLKGQDDRKTI